MLDCKKIAQMNEDDFLKWLESASKLDLKEVLECQELSDKRKSIIQREILKQELESKPSPPKP